MTREEEIRQAAAAYILEMYGEEDEDSDVSEGFREGAKWADETMIERAREWVKNTFTGPFGEGMANNIADEFIKAMKGDNHDNRRNN